jgi:hypothetical protein|uniref:Uncharacterized protein n=1 Tax=Bionectria ochroleuca TaxID=29856 RepID=A0A8H7NEH2_BIOOC
MNQGHCSKVTLCLSRAESWCDVSYAVREPGNVFCWPINRCSSQGRSTATASEISQTQADSLSPSYHIREIAVTSALVTEASLSSETVSGFPGLKAEFGGSLVHN